MKFKIHHKPSNDFIIVEGKNVEECIAKTRKEEEKRGWNREDCWSEKVV